MAQLLMDWRTSQGISRYEVAKSTGMNINTVKRLEEGEGGVTFEDGFRYFIYAESWSVSRRSECWDENRLATMALGVAL